MLVARGRPQKISREQWVEAAAELLGKRGVDAVRVEAVARILGVSKGGFYGHFADRRALLDAVVAMWAERGTEAIIEAVDAVQGGADARSEKLWALATQDSIAPELAIREWARRDEVVRAAVKRVDDRRMGYLRALFGEMGFSGADREARCMLVYSLLIGDHFIAAGHQRLSRKRVLAECRALLRQPFGATPRR